MRPLTLSDNVLTVLDNNPTEIMELVMYGTIVRVSLVIADYQQQLRSFYGTNIFPNSETAILRSGINFDLFHFGLCLSFETASQLSLHDIELRLLGDVKMLLKQYGVIVLKNVELSAEYRDIGHRNRFPHLNFHRDRNETQPTPFSLYTRDPYDNEQRRPRISSTLFIPNLVAYLQCMRQKDYSQIADKGIRSHYDIFQDEDMAAVIGKVAVENRWDEPEGTGEISMLDNRTMLHASYKRDGVKQGYRIGVRYLC